MKKNKKRLLVCGAVLTAAVLLVLSGGVWVRAEAAGRALSQKEENLQDRAVYQLEQLGQLLRSSSYGQEEGTVERICEDLENTVVLLQKEERESVWFYSFLQRVRQGEDAEKLAQECGGFMQWIRGEPWALGTVSEAEKPKSKTAFLNLPGFFVTEQAARKAAADFTGSEDLEPAAHTQGGTGLYRFTAPDQWVLVSKQGGVVISWQKNGGLGSDLLPSRDRIRVLEQKAAAFLSGKGFEKMTAVASRCLGGQLAVQLVPGQGSVLLLADSVWVFLDRKTGEVLGMEATAYYQNHCTRQPGTPEQPRSWAEDQLPQGVQILQGTLALDPEERLCYYFRYLEGGKETTACIDAGSGKWLS